MRRAEIRTTHGDAATATAVADAVRPDNTDEMRTRVEGDAVVTQIDRETTGGLRATADDYVVNLRVATQLADSTDRRERVQQTTDDTHQP